MTYAVGLAWGAITAALVALVLSLLDQPQGASAALSVSMLFAASAAIDKDRSE